MALHENLPIYRTGVELLILAFKVQQQMPRDVKRQLGDKITDRIVLLIDAMAMANATRGGERAWHLEDLLKHHRAVTVLLRAAHDAKYLAHGPWAEITKVLGSMGKQAGGWLKSVPNSEAPAA
jgi:hypothetical protein